MRTSIAMATYNGATFLQEQLDSFVSQSRQPDELVVCDDCSTDATPEVLERFSQHAPFSVRIYRNETNLGYTKTFEQALSNCSGELILLSDQDDIWFPTKVSIVEEAFLVNPDILLLIHDGELVDETLASHGATKLGQVKAGYGSNAWLVTGALTAISRNILSYALPIPDGITGHDGWLHYVARMLGMRIVLERRLQILRRHSSNTSEWIASTTKPIDRFAVIRDQYSNAPARSYEDRLLYNTNLVERIQSIEQSENAKTKFDRLEIIDRMQIERQAILNRENLLSLSSAHRKLMASKMLINGDYRHFNGIMSFFRDFLR